MNKRYIDIDSDTRVGYNYVKSKYYVTNKSYTTYRSTIALIQGVLSSLDITNITDTQLADLRDNLETLNSVSYTWSDTGSYIKTIQFNEFSDHPLVLDCEKSKLYVMNSTLIYDLTINESVTSVRIPYLCSYYKANLGLNITTTDMLYFYNLLFSYYSPVVYNQIKTPDENDEDLLNLYYTNIFVLSNYNKKSPVVYHGAYNALGTSNNTTEGYVASIDSSTQCIVPTEATTLSIGDKITIQGTETVVDGNSYTSDGIYTISDIQDNNIYVEESIPASYIFPFLACNLISVTAEIENIDRSTNTIILRHQVPDTIYVGDTIYIEGTTVTTDYETITCDGTYTVQAIVDKSIIVEEELPTNYTENTGTVHKELLISNISSITSNTKTISLYNNIDYTLTSSNQIMVRNTVTDEHDKYTVSSATTNTITVAENITAYTPQFPLIQLLVPTTETLISVTTSSIEEFPIGDFMLDTFAQAQAYLSTVFVGSMSSYVPSNTILTNINSKVPSTMNISTTTELTEMNLLGLYSKVYRKE